MWRTLGTALMLLLTAGCASGPILEPFGPEGPASLGAEPNLLYTHHSGEKGMDFIFENVFAVLKQSGFEVFEANRYDGRIETKPRVAPGLGRGLFPGSPNYSERVLATLQSYRHRAIIKVHPADDGFFIQATVFKELEDLPRPVRSTAGSALFRSENNVDRQFEVVDPSVFESNWIPKGRDLSYEQAILERLRRRL